MVAAVSGRRAMPYSTPPRVFERGVGRPTDAGPERRDAGHLAMMARRGADWFRAGGHRRRARNASGDAVRRIRPPRASTRCRAGRRSRRCWRPAGASRSAVAALLVGGYHGGWVPYDAVPPPSDVAGVAGAVRRGTGCRSRDGARLLGVRPAGRGGHRRIPRGAGRPAVRSVSQRAARPSPRRSASSPTGLRRPRLVREVERVSALVANRGACHHPAGTVRLVRSTLRTFSSEVTAHLHGWS